MACPLPTSPARTLITRPSAEIAASRIALGCECLDRRMWDEERDLPELGESGAGWARIQTGWSRCEERPGVYDFAWLERTVDRVLDAGVRPFFNLGYGNRLHTGAPTPDAVGWAPVYDPQARAAWLRFVDALAERFRDRVGHWEIWNEPDITVFWKHELPNPLKYAELVAATAPAIRARIPGATIIGGAVAFGTNPRGLQFVEQALRAGMGRHIDVLSYHTYRPRPEANRPEELTALRAMLARHGLDIPIWQGEAGCPSQRAEASALSGLPWTEERQAKMLLRRMLGDLDRGLGMSTWFHLADFPDYLVDGATGKAAWFGLLRAADGSRKPSFAAFQAVANLFDDATASDRELHAWIDLDESAPDGCARKDWLLTQLVPCSRRGRPLLAYWYPADLLPEANGTPPFAPGRITISLSHPQALAMSEPVLVDPLTHRVWPVACERQGFRFAIDPGSQLVFRDLPLLDHPLILTDAAALDLRAPGVSGWFRRWTIEPLAAGLLPAQEPHPAATGLRCRSTGHVDLRAHWAGRPDSSIAASATFTAGEDCEAELLLGADAPLRLWLDGRVVLDLPQPPPTAAPDAVRVPCRLAAGSHRVTVTAGSRSGQAVGFHLRLARPDGGTPPEP